MSERRRLRMTIEFDRDATPIVGQIERNDEPPLPFEGMLELMALVEAARRSEDHELAPPGSP